MATKNNYQTQINTVANFGVDVLIFGDEGPVTGEQVLKQIDKNKVITFACFRDPHGDLVADAGTTAQLKINNVAVGTAVPIEDIVGTCVPIPVDNLIVAGGARVPMSVEIAGGNVTAGCLNTVVVYF